MSVLMLVSKPVCSSVSLSNTSTQNRSLFHLNKKCAAVEHGKHRSQRIFPCFLASCFPALMRIPVRDAADRPVCSINPLNYRTTAVFDSNSQQIASINAMGNYATSVFSGNGSLIASQNELGFLTSFILDAASQRICVVDANNGRSTTIFTNLGYVSATQDQLGVFTSFTQDASGNNIQRVDGRNWPTTYTVDALNRTAYTQYIDNTRVTNTWDAAGQQLTSQDVTGITSFVWDNDSRKIATQNPTGINLTNTLDPVGNRLVLQDSFGTTTYTWDQQSRLSTIWNTLNERTTLTWDPLDREQHRVLANGGTISHTWDAAGRETLIENRNAAGAGQFIATNTYSPVNNRLTVVELDNTLSTFGYDASSQIVSEARSGTYAYARSYVWDPLGNRLQQYDSGVLTTSTFNSANQQTLITPASGPPTTQTYDPNGNLTVAVTGSAITTQTWSPENKLVGTASPTENESYLCSTDGLRKSQTTASGTTLFTYDEPLVLLETTTAGALQARNTDYPGEFGGLASQNRGGASSFYGYDSQGSTRILVSAGGLITDSYSYKVFGEPLQTGSGTVNPHTYIGIVRYRQQTNGFYLLEVRLLDPVTGQFISVDPIGFDGGDWNPRRYVGNSPTGFVDPTGLANSLCPDTKPGTVQGEDPVPWKVIPDPKGPPVSTRTHTFKHRGNPTTTTTYTVFCFIIVDQYCDAFKNPDATLYECVNSTTDPLPSPIPDKSWSPFPDPPWKKGRVTGPRFCDWMNGRSGTSTQQCYGMSIPGPDGSIQYIQLEPCPFTIDYGPGPAKRSSKGPDGRTTVWGPNGLVPG
jgi:RHS repeat-associated protein